MWEGHQLCEYYASRRGERGYAYELRNNYAADCQDGLRRIHVSFSYLGHAQNEWAIDLQYEWRQLYR